jgi:hypothetical protein
MQVRNAIAWEVMLRIHLTLAWSAVHFHLESYMDASNA